MRDRRRALPRTLVVTGHFPPARGGVQTFTWEILRRLPADRFVVVAPQQDGARAFDRTLGFPVIRRSGYWLTRDVRRLVADTSCTTAWIPASAPIGLCAPVLRRAGVERVVASSHGQELGWLRALPTREAYRLMARSFDVLTYLSAFTRSRLVEVVERPEILRQLAGGVDGRVFFPGARHPAVPPRGAGSPLVVSVSRLVRRKGHDVLLQAWPEVLHAVPDARLVIVGTGPMLERLRETAAAPAYRGSVRLPGRRPEQEVAAYLAAADVFVMPCRDDRRGLQTEGLGLAVLEASASGAPVVVGRSGGSVDSVVDGVTGTLVEAEEPAQVAAAIIDLLVDPVRARLMGDAGCDWVRTTWTWDPPADRLAEFLAG